LTYTVYGICEQGTDEIRYVGLTKNALDMRLYQHHHENKKLRRWLKQLDTLGLEPSIRVLETHDNYRKALERETALIQQYSSPRLLNKAHNDGHLPEFRLDVNVPVKVGRALFNEAKRQHISMSDLAGDILTDWFVKSELS
jgi:hypothetical protein